MQSEIAGREKVTDVIEHGGDLRLCRRFVEAAERRIERRTHIEQALEDLRAQHLVRTCQW